MIRFAIWLFSVVGMLPAQTDGDSSSLPCRKHAELRWEILSDVRKDLDSWCRTVGPPIITKFARPQADIRKIQLVSWNVNVGGGDVKGLYDKIRSENPDSGIVILLQEAYRSGPAVPATYPPQIKVPKAIRPTPRTPDIQQIASDMQMSLVYVPSMRNGADGLEDRGNAILSTEPLRDCGALEMPFGKQRRVAIACTVQLRGASKVEFRVVSLHMDTNDDRKLQAVELAKALAPQSAQPELLIAAGDTNSLQGRFDGSYRALNDALPELFCGNGHTAFWPFRLDIPFGWWRGRIDFMFSNGSRQSHVQSGECKTLHERRGSDHIPLQLILEVPADASNAGASERRTKQE